MPKYRQMATHVCEFSEGKKIIIPVMEYLLPVIPLIIYVIQMTSIELHKAEFLFYFMNHSESDLKSGPE